MIRVTFKHGVDQTMSEVLDDWNHALDWLNYWKHMCADLRDVEMVKL